MATASSSLSQTQKKIDTIANNIANVNTAGYKSREATFQNLLTQTYANQTGEAKSLEEKHQKIFALASAQKSA